MTDAATLTQTPDTDQFCTATHTPLVGAGNLLYDPAIYLLAAQLDAIEGLRKATDNRLRQATRSTADSDGEIRGLGMPADHPAIASTVAVSDGLAGLEHRVVLDLQRAVRKHPLGAWQKQQIGIGEKQLARLLAAIGDPYWNSLHDRPRTVSELWAYSGLHTLPVGQGVHGAQDEIADGAPTSAPPLAIAVPAPNHDPRGAARRTKGQRANWSTDAKTRAYLIAESCVKQARSPYRKVYDLRREATADRMHDRPCPQCNGKGKTGLELTPWRAGHQHADALRIVSKAILRDLWTAGRDWYKDQELTA